MTRPAEQLMNNAEVFNAMSAELLSNGNSIRFRAEGQSMQPTIRSGEAITVEPVAPATVKRGDIVLYRTTSGVIAHRVIRVQRAKGTMPTAFILRGDASRICDDPVISEQVLGKVVAVERAGQHRILHPKRDNIMRKTRLYASRLKRCMERVQQVMRGIPSDTVARKPTSKHRGWRKPPSHHLVMALLVLNWVWIGSSHILPTEAAEKEALRAAEDAVAQAMVTSAQVRVPVSIVKAHQHEDSVIQTTQAAVERQVEIALDVYQHAILAASPTVQKAMGFVAQAASMAAQAQANVAVAQAQVQFLQAERRQASQPATAIQIIATTNAAMRAAERAALHAAAAEKQVQAALLASRQVLAATTEAEAQAAVGVVQAVHDVVIARSVAAGAQVALVLAHVTRDTAVLDAAREVAAAAVHVAARSEAQVQVNGAASRRLPIDQTTAAAQEAQAAMVWTQVAAVQAQIAVKLARRQGLDDASVAQAAARLANVQVEAARQASQRATETSSVTVAQAAVTAAYTAAATASAAARVAVAQLQVAVAQATEETSMAATAAQVAAAEQLQMAVAGAWEAAELSTLVYATAAQVQEDSTQTTGVPSTEAILVQKSAQQSQEQAQLAMSWAQSATGWAQASVAWSQGMKETAVAAEAAAIASESSATRVQAAVAVINTAASASTASMAAVATPSLDPPSIEDVLSKELTEEVVEESDTTTPLLEPILTIEDVERDDRVASPSQ